MHVQSDNFNLFFLKVYSDGFEVNSVIGEVPYELQVQNLGFELGNSRELYQVKTSNAFLSLCDNVGLISANNGYSKREVFASSK